MSEEDIRQVGYILCMVTGLELTRPQLQGLKLDAIRSHKWIIMACSAMTGSNLIEGLQWVVQDAKDRLFLY